MDPHRINVSLRLLFLLALTLAVGCSSPSKGEKQVQSYTKTRDLLGGAQQVDITLACMHALRATPADRLDLAFVQYKDAVADLEKEGESARWQAQVMKEKADAHIASWQKEMESITDPTMKASMESRREAVRSNFALIKMYADDVRKAYDPFLKGNKQMVQALSIDLSPATLATLSESMAHITADGAGLKQKLFSMQNAMNNIAGGLSPLGL